jgi:hypothetical protein
MLLLPERRRRAPPAAEPADAAAAERPGNLLVVAFNFPHNIQRFAKSLLSHVFDLLVGVAFR